MAADDMPEIGQPVQFSSLPGFGVSGVYFLYWKGEVVYVGQSRNIRKRIASHLAEGEKSFDSVAMMPLMKGLTRTERYFIRTLTPKYNQCGLARKARFYKSIGYVEPAAVPRSLRPPSVFAKGVDVCFTEGEMEGREGKVSRCKNGRAFVVCDGWRRPVKVRVEALRLV